MKAFRVSGGGEKKEAEERREIVCGWGVGGGLMKGILRYLVWLYNELFLLVLWKFNYTQDNTCLDVCAFVCVCVFLGSVFVFVFKV